MKKSVRWTRQQKIDGLIDVIFMLVFLLCLMLLKYWGISTSFLWPILLFHPIANKKIHTATKENHLKYK